MIQLLVSFCRLDHREQMSFGDAVVAAPFFPTGEDDVEHLRETMIRRIVVDDGTVTKKITFINIIKLG